jgi:3-phosphoglycerate kinase
MKSIEEADIVPGTLVLVRTDWNLPIKDGKILDTARLAASTETINYILKKGGKVIVLSHLGDGTDSLEIVAKEAEKFFPETKIRFVRDPWNASSLDGRQALENLRSGEIAVFENLRFWREEENNDCFTEQLACFGDIYVNEAFSVSHRVHTSIVGLPKFLPAYVGFKFLEEYKKLSEIFNPKHPFLFILGGAKFETKLPLVEKFLKIADEIFIGGANALPASGEAFADNPKIIFPIGDLMALDISPETLEILSGKIKEAKFILWNGPLGNYEKGFTAGTIALSKMLAEAKAKIVLGGGDTLATIEEEIKDKISSHGFVSIAGGAMLEFLANGTLPGIEALK